MKEYTDMVSKEFLEKALGRKIDTYTISTGSNVGDNYTSILFSFEVDFSTEVADGKKAEKAHLIAKCYPVNAARQDFLMQSNFFWKELEFYQTYVPKLIQMQKDLNMTEIIQPAFPPLVAGKGIDFYKEPIIPGKVYAPFDHYVMMVDLRKTYGFKMFDRHQCMDKNHVSLAMEAMAKNHALSWVYKQKNDLENLTDHFPFMKNGYSLQSLIDVVAISAEGNGKLATDTLETVLGKHSPIVQGAKKFTERIVDAMNVLYGADLEKNAKNFENHFRVKPQTFNDEEQWKVGILGDVWSNNLLFRYNKDSGMPEEVINVDLQMCGEFCPTTDLAYLIYASTDSKFRKMYLDEMLNLYVEKFKSICQLFGVEPLSNFTKSEFKRRFHRAKVYGLATALLVLPFSQMDTENIEDWETKEGGDINEMIASMCDNNNSVNKRYLERVTGLATEMYEEGII